MHESFLDLWARSALTSAAFFWKALWAFVLGYTISSMIQVFVTRERMQAAMGEAGPRSVALGTTFGFVSSSCSFAALATTRSLFKKGAGLVPSLAFLLASTNLVVELGVVIAIFLSWQFVVGEYVGGLLLILVTWLIVRVTDPRELVESVRERLGDEGDDDAAPTAPIRERIRRRREWRRVAQRYVMEWSMVAKDVTIGFVVAGVIAVFVPQSFFETLFPGSATDDAGFLSVLADAVVGPVAAFFTFIGSMGNVPLAGLLYANGVSFAGVMAFLFSDLVVLPVIRIQIGYYGWRMALYIAGVFLAALVTVAVALHYAFDIAGILPEGGSVRPGERDPEFAVDHTFFLNLAFLGVTALFLWLRSSDGGERDHDEHDHDEHDHDDREHHDDHDHDHDHDHGGGPSPLERVIGGVAWVAVVWLVGGLVAAAFR